MHNLKFRIDIEVGVGGIDWIHLAQDKDSGNQLSISRKHREIVE
jgi:hypothetical protein